jgi:TIR domain/CHAT domain
MWVNVYQVINCSKKLMTSFQTILFLGANSQDTSRLRLDQELRDISEGLQRSQQRDQFNLQQKWAVRPRDIQRAMLDLQPQIVHFSGHGEGEAGLVFEDEVGKSKLVDGAALAGLFKLFADQLHCVVLNGCYSEVQAKAISQHIPYVIGMNQAIDDKAAIAFAVGFYDALGAGRDVEFAYKLGCNAIQMEGIAEHLTPVLLQKPIVAGGNQAINDVPVMAIPSKAENSSDLMEVFFSYAHEDEGLRNELAKHLKLLERQKVIKGWHDRKITAGEEWKDLIDDHLEAADIILLLISSDFMASDYCYDVELARAMERHALKEARVIPVILRSVDWRDAAFGKLAALPTDGKPITEWPDKDIAFTNVVRGIKGVIQSLQTTQPAAGKDNRFSSRGAAPTVGVPTGANQNNSGESIGIQNQNSGGETYAGGTVNVVKGGFFQPGWQVNTVNQIQGDLNVTQEDQSGNFIDDLKDRTESES